MHLATLISVHGKHKVHVNYLENCQTRYRSNPLMGQTLTDGPNEFELSKFDCIDIFDRISDNIVHIQNETNNSWSYAMISMQEHPYTLILLRMTPMIIKVHFLMNM